MYSRICVLWLTFLVYNVDFFCLSFHDFYYEVAAFIHEFLKAVRVMLENTHPSNMNRWFNFSKSRRKQQTHRPDSFEALAPLLYTWKPKVKTYLILWLHGDYEVTDGGQIGISVSSSIWECLLLKFSVIKSYYTTSHQKLEEAGTCTSWKIVTFLYLPIWFLCFDNFLQMLWHLIFAIKLSYYCIYCDPQYWNKTQTFHSHKELSVWHFAVIFSVEYCFEMAETTFYRA